MLKLSVFCLAIFFVFTLQQETVEEPKDVVKKCLAFKSSFDGMLVGELTDQKPYLLPMDPDRMTDEYKQRAIEKIKEIYGWDFSKPVEGLELEAVQSNPEFKHFLTGGYAEDLKETAFPSSNVQIKDDLWRIKVLNEAGVDIPNMTGKKLMQNQLVAYGELNFVDDQGKEILKKIIYWNKLPLTESENGLMPLVFDLKSEDYGDGLLVGSQLIRDVNGKKLLIHRATQSFPGILDETQTSNIECKDLLLKKISEKNPEVKK
eukprot:gene5648-9464_t